MSRQESNLAKISHILGVDFGTVKIGLALADTETRIAFTYNTLPKDKNFWPKMKEIIKKENIKNIVIGNAKYIKENKSHEKLAQELSKKFPAVKIELQDEMFTTKMAQANLIEKGMKDVGKIDDSEAARIILQSWLDTKNVIK